MIEAFANSMAVIILQHISASNQHVVCLSLHNVVCQLDLNKRREDRKLMKIVNTEMGDP